jgi:transcriptional regulator with XRE-family HTH domain
MAYQSSPLEDIHAVQSQDLLVEVQPMDMPAKKRLEPRDIAIGARIRAVRLKTPSPDPKRNGKPMQQSELGRLIGLLTTTSMYRYEKGYPVPVDKLQKIAEVCGTTIDHLRGREEETAAAPRKPVGQQGLMSIAQLALRAAQEATPENLKALTDAMRELQ